ncbi:hypothetical protein ACFL46_03560 [Candidatus Neomarinimicrobiota bacterium]
MQRIIKLSICLLVLAFIFSGCSFSDFDSNNLATWSINLEFPILMTSFDATELLGDNDQIEKRYDPESGDSIFVFKSNTLMDIEVQSFTVTTSGGKTVPIPVIIEPIEQEIEAFTDEFDGFNFVQVDLYLIPDITGFESDLADSANIILTITAINDDGQMEETEVPSTNILNGNPIYVDDAERLLNIRPDRITADGVLIIYPSGEPGSHFSNQDLPVMLVIEAPLNIEITETATYEIESQKVQMDIDDAIESIKVFIDSDNDFDFGADLDILAARDTMYFKEGSLIRPDTITQMTIHPNTPREIIIFDLGPEKYELFQDSTYVTGKMRLLSNVDSQGNPTSSKLLSKDSLKVLVYTSVSVLVDPDDQGGN